VTAVTEPVTETAPTSRSAAKPEAGECRWERERGSGGPSLAFVLLLPALLLLIFGGIQYGMHDYARSLALAAAQAGVRAATQAPASATRGQQAAQEFVAGQAAGTLTDATVTATLDGSVITVTVTAVAPSLVPLTQPRVSQQASGAVEVLP
jgi:Flp pilus assembly protein TadG